MWLAGIDFGSKLAGTTVISIAEKVGGFYNYKGAFSVIKGKDADLFLSNYFNQFNFNLVGIDAPLSLPKVYTINKGNEYFYRKSDKELSAMSPMFIGGLTARAIKLKDKFSSNTLNIFETYPKAKAIELNLIDLGYKTKNAEAFEACLEFIKNLSGWDLKLNNWHQFDSILALISTIDFAENKAKSYGDPEEGLIWV